MEDNNKHNNIRAFSPVEDIVLDYMESDEISGNSNKNNNAVTQSAKKLIENDENLCKTNRSSTSQKKNQNLSKKLSENLSEQSSNAKHRLSSTRDNNCKSDDNEKQLKHKSNTSAETDNNLEENNLNKNVLNENTIKTDCNVSLQTNKNNSLSSSKENFENNVKKKSSSSKKQNENQHEQKRPRTPLSPCPDTASQNEDDFDEIGVENADHMDGFYEDQSENNCRNNEREGSNNSRRRLSGHSPIRMPPRNDDVPQAYQKRQKRNFHHVRPRPSAMDRRLAINKRNRILRLREAQRNRLGVSRLHLPPPRLPLRRSSYRSKPQSSSKSHKVQPLIGRRNSTDEFDLKEYLARRNPAYYPPPRSRKSRSPPPLARINTGNNRYLTSRRDTRAIPSLFSSFSQRRYSPVERYQVEKRSSVYNPLSYSVRKSRSPREHVPYRPPATRHRTNMVYEPNMFNNSSFNPLSSPPRNYNNRAYCNSYNNNRIHGSVPVSYPSVSRRRSRSPQIYEGGNRVSMPSSAALSNRVYHRNNTYPPPVINKTFNKNYSRGAPSFRSSGYRGRGSGREGSQRYGRPPPIKRWHCPKRESSPGN